VHATDPDIAAYLLNLAAVTAISHAISSGDDEALARVVRGTKELYVKALAPVGAAVQPSTTAPRKRRSRRPAAP
jgi:hypothetical protein